ncbi:hypothetical protein M899_0312 [Bacteriovorax sp. BSW11_IV]|nr:hypothetical protein M899_0312 [Bacteriovorax sp. BSW11_IV]
MPLPAPARINTGPSMVSAASRCLSFSPESEIMSTKYRKSVHEAMNITG